MPTLTKREIEAIQGAIAAAVEAMLTALNQGSDATRKKAVEVAEQAARRELLKISLP